MNSTVSLKIIKGLYNYKRPYREFAEDESTGSGFVIDIAKGYVVTNAHVVADAVSIIGRFIKTGKKDISLELVGICREKDLALLKINDSDLSLLSSIENLKFGDSMFVRQGDKVKALGYQLGSNNIKVTEGVVSGFERFESGDLGREDSISRRPGYIQITAAINSSGGPLLNANNEVIGIISSGNKNTGYAIPSRTFLAIYKELKNGVVKMPTLALDWCRTNREIMKKQTGNSSTYGIYVRKIYPDSCCDVLEKGDIIRRIDYMDPFWKSNGESNKNVFSLNEKDNKDPAVLVTIFLDRFGTSTNIGRLKNPVEADETKINFEKIFTERKLEISEIMDMVPIGAEIMLNICRLVDGQPMWYMLKTNYITMPVYRIPYIYPIINPIDYEIFGGMCVTDLSMEILKGYGIRVDLYERRVIIVQTFPNTTVYKTDVIREGYIIKSIYAYDKDMVLIKESHRQLQSLDDLRSVLKLGGEFLQVNCMDDSTFIFSPSSTEDDLIRRSYRIS